MKLLHVIPGMDPAMGGVCQAVRTMIQGLSGIGVANEVVSLDSANAAFLSGDRFITHTLGPVKNPWYYSNKLVPWLLDNFSRFDSVIVHGLWHYHSFAVTKAFRLFKTRADENAKDAGDIPKIYVMPHGMLDPYFQRATDRRLKAIRNRLYWKMIERQVINGADGVFFTSALEQRLAAEPFHPYHPKRQKVVGLGVEEPPLYHQQMRTAFLEKCPDIKGQPYLLFLSRIDKKKGVELLISAYYTVFKKYDSKKNNLPKLIIAGPGLETPYGKKMLRLVADYALGNYIFFPGMLTGAAKWGAFYGSEAFILPSHQENFGIAVVEALACGKPVLISDQVNIWKEIKAAGGGLIAEDTLEGVQQLLEKWSTIENAEKIKMGHLAKNIFKNHFGMAVASTHFLNAI